MNAVNLLPGGRTGGRSISGLGTRPVAIVAAACVVGGLMLWAHNVRSEAAHLTTEVATATADRDALTSQLGDARAEQARVDKIAARRGAVVALASGRINWERVVRDTAQVVPEGVWLSAINGAVNPPAAPSRGAAPGVPEATTTPQGLHLEGYALTQDHIALLLARLAAVPGLGQPRLDSSESILRGDRTVVQFIIDAAIDKRALDQPTLTVARSAPNTANTGNEAFRP